MMQKYPPVTLRILFLILAATLSLCATAETSEELDVAILNGRVIDPASGLDAIRNVGIRGDKVVVVTKDELTAAKEIDATGLVVSPGFIDLHAHGQSILSNRVQAFDGVTTALELELGSFPIDDFYRVREQEGRPINYGASVNWASARIAALLDVPPSSDSDWFERMMGKSGWQNTVASEQQLAEIVSLVEQGLDAGGLGVGFLTGYAPGSGKKEYYAVSQLAAKRDLPTFTHARFLSMLEPESSFEGIQEIIGVAASTGVHAHIVHLNSISLKDIKLIRQMIEEAQSRGLSLTTEGYPYGAGATGIGAAMFRGPDWRERAGNISAGNFEIDGKRLTQEEFDQLQKNEPGTEVIVHFLDTQKPAEQALLDTALLMPEGIIASDGGEWMVKGNQVEQHTWPLPDNAWSHPRSAGSFSRFIRLYVREKQALTLSEAIEKVSYLPAKMLQDAIPQMKSKGRIQPGADADIVVFSPETVSDTATFSQSASLSEGMKYVIVNGKTVISGGKLDTTILPGRAVRNESQ